MSNNHGRVEKIGHWSNDDEENNDMSQGDERDEKDSAGFVDSKENKWVLNKAGVNRVLLDTVEARKLAYYGHDEQRSCLEKEIMQGTMPDARR